MAIFDNGLAPITNVADEAPASVPRSKFNMSCVKYTNGIIGALEPIDLLETLPNEDYEIGYDILAQLRNPTVRQALNGMKIFVHTYWCPKKDLWKGFKNYITGGRSGNVTLEVPKIYPVIAHGIKNDDNTVTYTDINKSRIELGKYDVNTFVPFAPSSFMGLPIAVKPSLNGREEGSIYENKNYWYRAVGHKSISITPMQGSNVENVDSDMYWGVTALPFVMYNKIYRDYYANENMLSKNKNWYHDDEDQDLILPYSLPADNLTGYTNCTDGNLYKLEETDLERAYVPCYNETETNGDKPMLNMLHFRQFRGDYFTTANIFKDLLRGNAEDIPSNDLKLDFDDFVDSIRGWNKAFSSGNVPMSIGVARYDASATERNIPTLFLTGVEAPAGTSSDLKLKEYGSVDQATFNGYKDYLKEALKKGVSGKTNITLNNLRKAIVMEKLMMRNATTNGNYRELIGIQFGYYPNDYTRRPTLVGGTSYDVNFDTVTATNFDTNANNLGQKTSNGYASGSGYIGKFHSDDHGYLMTILSIVPDVYYATQGLDNMFTRTTKDQEYTPILNNLEPMAIKNKELYVSKSTEYNNDVWGYADRFEDWKTRRNKVSGLAVCGELYDRAQFMFREFNESNRPNLNEKFMAMTPNNIDMSMFSTVNEPPFDLTIGCNITKVSPMPYKAHPADMGIAY